MRVERVERAKEKFKVILSNLKSFIGKHCWLFNEFPPFKISNFSWVSTLRYKNYQLNIKNKILFNFLHKIQTLRQIINRSNKTFSHAPRSTFYSFFRKKSNLQADYVEGPSTCSSLKDERQSLHRTHSLTFIFYFAGCSLTEQ